MKDVIHEVRDRRRKIAVVGLGYVGLPLALAFGRTADVIGYDPDEAKLSSYRQGRDPSGDVSADAFSDVTVEYVSDPAFLAEAGFYVVAVPTPIRSGNVPDLRDVQAASRSVGRALKRDAIVVFESTVYPGVTEEVCIPILEQESGLRCGEDFKVGYSPERINPGDREHRLENVVKIVSGVDEEALDAIASVYELVVEAGIYRAESIKVAEAAKVIENAQRDINIAFMNELSILFHQMNIDTASVLNAAKTKWNFLDFRPGLVGGHCIGIDPYYLTYKAQASGYTSRIISAGRQVNDGMGKYIGRQIVKLVVQQGLDPRGVKIGLLGLTYKENCRDIRNTKVTDIVQELREYGLEPVVADPWADDDRAMAEYGIRLSSVEAFKGLNVVVVAVPHREFASLTAADFAGMCDEGREKIFVDVKSVYSKAALQALGFRYWSL
ncbi:nucleotide sugar dehydrogenase [Paenibacillus sp. TRM 82003]|nr:nucleotide sugar dehydrogenase [Paenibacillus sp. TRM 82003]